MIQGWITAAPLSESMLPKLQVSGVSKRFGGLQALDDLSFDVPAGTVAGLIGPNGSGKSTLFNVITSVARPDRGRIYLRGRRIDRMPLHRIARLGLGRTFQEVKIFRDLSVWENLSIAAMGRAVVNWERKAQSWLEEMGLVHLKDDVADTLSVGQQRLLEISMNLLVEPDLLLLDEPLAGVHPVIRNRIGEVIRKQRSEGRTFLIIEHDLRFVMDLCDNVVVLQQGRKIAEGLPSSIRQNPLVVSAMLGGVAK